MLDPMGSSSTTISKTCYGSIHIILWKGDLTSYTLCDNPAFVIFRSGLKFVAITVKIKINI